MIYLDNAATTFPKPPEVEHAVWRHFIQLEMQEEERMRQHWMRRGSFMEPESGLQSYFMRRMHLVLRLPPM